MLFVKTSLLVLLLATVQASNQGFGVGDHFVEDPEEAAFVDALLAATQEGATNFEDRVLEDRDLGFLTARVRARICNRKLATCRQAQAKDLPVTKWKNQIEDLSPEDPIGLQSNLRVLVDLTENADYTGYVTDILTGKNKVKLFCGVSQGSSERC